jgi:uncharacterized membrane protein
MTHTCPTKQATARPACTAATVGMFALLAAALAFGTEADLDSKRGHLVMDIRAAGYQPDWTFRLDGEGRLSFSVDRMQSVVLRTAPAPGGVDHPGGLVLGTQSDAGGLVAEVASASCTDGKSGERLTHRVTIRYRGTEYRGCGTLIEVPLR